MRKKTSYRNWSKSAETCYTKSCWQFAHGFSIWKTKNILECSRLKGSKAHNWCTHVQQLRDISIKPSGSCSASDSACHACSVVWLLPASSTDFWLARRRRLWAKFHELHTILGVLRNVAAIAHSLVAEGKKWTWHARCHEWVAAKDLLSLFCQGGVGEQGNMLFLIRFSLSVVSCKTTSWLGRICCAKPSTSHIPHLDLIIPPQIVPMIYFRFFLENILQDSTIGENHPLQAFLVHIRSKPSIGLGDFFRFGNAMRLPSSGIEAKVSCCKAEKGCQSSQQASLKIGRKQKFVGRACGMPSKQNLPLDICSQWHLHRHACALQLYLSFTSLGEKFAERPERMRSCMHVCILYTQHQNVATEDCMLEVCLLNHLSSLLCRVHICVWNSNPPQYLGPLSPLQYVYNC